MVQRAVADARRCADAGWAWVLEQVREDEHGPWIPLTVPLTGDAVISEPDRDLLYDGIAGLAPALGELRLARDLTESELAVADSVVARLRAADLADECGLFTGLGGSLVAVALLDPGAIAPVLRAIAARSTPQGWPSRMFGEAPVVGNDVVLGDAGTVLACAWVDDASALPLVELGADALAAKAIPANSGLSWAMYQGDRDRVMPNYSHGTAGIAAALAVAGHRLGRPDHVETARLGAEHLVSLADLDGGGFKLPLQIPPAEDREPVAYGWCHGPTGTVNLFGALELAGVAEIASISTREWRDRCFRTLSVSGIPDRLRPGFWDNDGRCCGTAGVLDAVLTHAQATRDESHLVFADRLAAVLVERSEAMSSDGSRCCWRFLEHRDTPPEHDPGVGWMQGAAGIVAALSRYARVREQGLDAARLGLPVDWWMAPVG